ncbi:MAG: ATP-dependent RecD-like DNA helicase [Chloroflexota bacterium]
MATLSGSIDRIVFRNTDTGFCVARFRLLETYRKSDDVTTVVGTMPSIRPGEVLLLTGSWDQHPIHGRNFRVDRYEQEMPATAEGIERYLGSGAVRGIGPVTASRIVDVFGDKTLQILDSDPERLEVVPGISAKRLQTIQESWAEQNCIRDLSIFLQDHGLSVALARRIFDVYGSRAVEVIRTDPFQLAHTIQGVGFRTADGVAQALGMSKRSQSRYIAGLRFVLSQASDDGHVFLAREMLLERAMRVLEVPIQELEPALLETVRRGDAVADGNDIYLAAFHRAESGAAKHLLDICSTSSPLTLDRHFDPEEAARMAAEAQGLVLAPKQLRAVEQSLREKVSILTGGPGTGKTSTLRTIISALESADISFCICAPTGRAAKRAAETTSRPASTVHRLLEYQPGPNTFGYDTQRPLPFDFVIVDEVSMLDILLFYHLLKAMPRESHLVLVGDADQLPAVGPGSVLRDLIESKSIATVTLTDLFRQARGSQIVLAAHEVNAGRVPVFSNEADQDFYFVPTATDLDALHTIKKLVLERIPRKFGFSAMDDVQVLAPMHVGPVGVAALNSELQSLLNPPRPDLPELQRSGRAFRVGDRVMQIRNNYEKDVYNGDMGRVVSLRPDDVHLTVAFGSASSRTEVPYESADLDQLVLAYAVSVHKAQGSEFPCVVMPVVTRHFMMLQRNLLYTAITRASQLCVLVGSERALRTAVTSIRKETRNSRLGARLSNAPASLELGLV